MGGEAKAKFFLRATSEACGVPISERVAWKGAAAAAG